ncbi:MAG: hypothetical protein RIS06_1222 [Actinomycetota bacterium]
MAIANYLYLSAILFTIGAIGVVVRRNSIVVFMCIELMLNAANLAFVTFARINSNLEGQVIAFFTMVGSCWTCNNCDNLSIKANCIC